MLRSRAGRWTADDMPALDGTIALVTGASSGLGQCIATALARRGATVVAACRSPAKAHRIRDNLPASLRPRLHCVELDLADLASVRRCAGQVVDAHPRLDLLCNNAGIMAFPYGRTRDGFELQFGTNHLGHFALTGLLLDRLAAAPAARVVTMASQAHLWIDAPRFDAAEQPGAYDKWQAYSRSKLANLLFTHELQRRLRTHAASIIAVAAHPGYAATNLGAPAGEGSRLARAALSLGNALLAQAPEMGALPALFAATHAQVQGGDYIGPGGWRQIRGYPRKVGCRPTARDPVLARELWALSERLTGITYLS